ncbi:PEP-CTERM sorting domain-containing protein [Persicirhabdus sediminis]|uniref:PEP-CTERM sorting domain-containing protein n=1 Tax=Persicirhabdus sediminis TaxID=454144 RepID=A0A8J7SJ49_9BACT|nr:PEP-CTERM sorting domain-containing protein [Persicirhabdus sediminis]MBK1790886.1 PEP-CTERM sorting domain-containing protein [Persicirhabdus sediminis]
MSAASAATTLISNSPENSPVTPNNKSAVGVPSPVVPPTASNFQIQLSAPEFTPNPQFTADLQLTNMVVKSAPAGVLPTAVPVESPVIIMPMNNFDGLQDSPSQQPMNFLSETAPIPEPSTTALIGSALAIGLLRRRRQS